MNIAFYKYQGTGNDFVMIDNRTNAFPKSNTNIISNLCDRHFGIGADGVILIENDTEFDFKMIYFNADGSQTFCGNGGRCAVAFAKKLKIIDLKTKIGSGYIINQVRNPDYYNPVNGHQYFVTIRDDNKITAMPQIPFIETEINITVPPEDMTIDNFMTIGHIVRYVKG